MTQFCRKGCILLICGLPSSGKTLLTNNFIKFSKLNTKSNLVFYKISIDELIPIKDQSIQIQTNSGFWRQFRHDLRFATNLFLNQLMNNKLDINEDIDENVWSLLESIRRQNNICSTHELGISSEHFVVIIDDNFYYKSMRYEFFQTSKLFGLGFAIIMINCSLDSTLIRNRLRTEDKCIPEDVIIKMSERFECPKPEGFEFRTFFVCTESFNFNITEELTQFITDAINNPIVDSTILSPEEQEFRQRLDIKSKENLIHKIDCILRQLINELIIESIDKKVIGKSLNESKKCLLTELKKSMDLLPQNIIKNIMETNGKQNEETNQFLISLLSKEIKY